MGLTTTGALCLSLCDFIRLCAGFLVVAQFLCEKHRLQSTSSWNGPALQQLDVRSFDGVDVNIVATLDFKDQSFVSARSRQSGSVILPAVGIGSRR